MNAQPPILVAGTNREEIANLFRFARVLAAGQSRAIHLLGLISVAESESLSSGANPAQHLRRGLEKLARQANAQSVVRVAHNPWREVEAVTRSEGCELLLVSWASAFPSEALRAMPCDVVVVNGAFPKKLKRILLPIRGGPYAALSLKIALAFAQTARVKITPLRASLASQREDRTQHEFLERLSTLPEIGDPITARGNAAEVILRLARSQDYQLVVMGAIAQPRPGDPVIGPTATRVAQQSHAPLLIVKTCDAIPRASSPVDYTISVVVDKWFAENTFHAHEFADIAQLVRLKNEQGLTISLGLPTLNEEKTIGKIVKMMRKQFVECYPLLDEIVVIDSDSTDRTVEIAEHLGVPVVKHPDVLRQYQVWEGKGEALWNSLYVLKGDLIAWIDTDIVNIHPRFVYGILGPLIREPRLMYVKGFYQRPIQLGRRLQARGGGRVTELVARPLFNLFYPELSGFVQPLAGEYAGRREALEAVPFFVGYGVETGLLIDIWKRFGLQAMGQVDLEERVHRNQSLIALSKMAFEIVQVVMQRVGEQRGLELVNELNKSLKLIRQEPRQFQLDIHEIRARERPPMLTIPEYQRKRRRLASSRHRH